MAFWHIMHWLYGSQMTANQCVVLFQCSCSHMHKRANVAQSVTIETEEALSFRAVKEDKNEGFQNIKS